MTKEERYLRKRISISRVRVSFWKNKTEEYKKELNSLKEKTIKANKDKAVFIVGLIRDRYVLDENYNLYVGLTREKLDPIYKATKLVNDNVKLKLKDIGALFNRDRSTINYILKTVDDWLYSDKDFRMEYESILKENNLKHKTYKPRK